MHLSFIHNSGCFRNAKRSPKAPHQEQCIIHISEDESNLITPKDIDSWQTLLKTADIRNYKPVLASAKTVEEGAIPSSVVYHRKCRNLLKMMQEREKLSCAKHKGKETENPMEIQK